MMWVEWVRAGKDGVVGVGSLGLAKAASWCEMCVSYRWEFISITCVNQYISSYRIYVSISVLVESSPGSDDHRITFIPLLHPLKRTSFFVSLVKIHSCPYAFTIDFLFLVWRFDSSFWFLVLMRAFRVLDQNSAQHRSNWLLLIIIYELDCIIAFFFCFLCFFVVVW